MSHMKRYWLVCFIICLLSLPSLYSADAQGDPELAQAYHHEQGLSFRLPETWVIYDEAYPLLFVANSEEAMDASGVAQGHLFITIDVQSYADWADELPTGDPMTPLAALEALDARYQRNNDAQPPNITEAMNSPEDYTLPTATYAGTNTADELDWIIWMMVDEASEIVIFVQAAAVAGAMPDYANEVYAFAKTINYQTYMHYPSRFTNEELPFSFEHPDWFDVVVRDETMVFLASDEALLTTSNMSGDDIFMGITLGDMTNLDPALQLVIDNPQAFSETLLNLSFPNAEIISTIEQSHVLGDSVRFSAHWNDVVVVMEIIFLAERDEFINAIIVSPIDTPHDTHMILTNVLETLSFSQTTPTDYPTQFYPDRFISDDLKFSFEYPDWYDVYVNTSRMAILIPDGQTINLNNIAANGEFFVIMVGYIIDDMPTDITALAEYIVPHTYLEATFLGATPSTNPLGDAADFTMIWEGVFWQGHLVVIPNSVQDQYVVIAESFTMDYSDVLINISASVIITE